MTVRNHQHPDRPSGGWPQLIYDLGAAEGYDTAEYLRNGYRVVAVEPRPDAVATLHKRFAEEIAAGRLVVVPKGISELSGQATFWLCEDDRFCSTFNPDFMRRWGRRHRPITVPTVTFRELLEQYGRATYWKIDIEGSDYLCLVDPGVENLPLYLSVEIVDAVHPLVRRLSELGYRRFKLISQRSFDQPSATLARTKLRFGGAPRWLRTVYRRLAAIVRYWQRTPPGPSGPFGEGTPGHWLSAEDVTELARLVRAAHEDTDWYDLHAGLGDG